MKLDTTIENSNYHIQKLLIYANLLYYNGLAYGVMLMTLDNNSLEVKYN